MTFIPVVQKGFTYTISLNLVFVYILIFAGLAVFAFSSADWPSYKEAVESVYEIRNSYRVVAVSIEAFWRDIAVMVGGNIYLWRAFVWLPCYAALFLYFCLFVSPKDRLICIFLFCFLMLYRVGGTRQGLSVILFYFAFMLLRGKLPRKIIAIGLMVCCFFLHKGTILFFPALIASFIKPTKRIIRFSILMEAVLFIWFKLFFVDFMNSLLPGSWQLFYLEADDKSNWSRRTLYVSMIMDWVKFGFVFALLVKAFKSRLTKRGMQYRNYLFYGFLLYCILWFSGFRYTLTERYFGLMLMFPVIMLLVEILDRKKWKPFSFTAFFWLYTLLFFIQNNINISGFVGLGAGKLG
jgi:hypothetical protein